MVQARDKGFQNADNIAVVLVVVCPSFSRVVSLFCLSLSLCVPSFVSAPPLVPVHPPTHHIAQVLGALAKTGYADKPLTQRLLADLLLLPARAVTLTAAVKILHAMASTRTHNAAALAYLAAILALDRPVPAVGGESGGKGERGAEEDQCEWTAQSVAVTLSSMSKLRWGDEAVIHAVTTAAGSIPAQSYSVQSVSMMANALAAFQKANLLFSSIGSLEAEVWRLVVSVPPDAWTPRALALVANAAGWLAHNRKGPARRDRVRRGGTTMGKWQVRRVGDVDGGKRSKVAEEDCDQKEMAGEEKGRDREQRRIARGQKSHSRHVAVQGQAGLEKVLQVNLLMYRTYIRTKGRDDESECCR